jgi:flagellar motor component MotA
MKTLSVWSGILASIAVGCALQGLHPQTFIHPHAALMVFGPMLATLLFLCGPKGSISWFKRVYSANCNEQDREVARQLTSMAYLCGGIAFLTGTMHVFGNLANTSVIGSGVAVAMVGLLYGCIPALLLAPVTRANAAMNASNNGKPMLYVAACFAGASLMVTTVLYALSRFN